MKWLKLELPDKLFGLDTGIITVFLPTVGVLVLAILSFGWIINPRIDDYNRSMDNVNSGKQKLATINEKIKYLRSIDMEKLSKDEVLVNNALLPQKNAYLLVNIVRKLGESYGFSVDSFKVSLDDIKTDEATVKKSKDDGYASVPVAVKLVGSADKYVDLIAGIEESLPLMSFDKFNVVKIGTSVELNLEISAYYATEKSQVDVSKLSLSDLTMNKDEGDLVAQISKFKPIENLNLVEGNLKLDGQFTKYTRSDPFGL